MKTKYVLLILLVVTKFVVAETPIFQSTIDGDIWTSENGPYIIKGDITIEDLTIQAGVEVIFEADYRFEVNGILKAQGFHSDSIYFKSDSLNITGWKGINFKNTAIASFLVYCRIEGAHGQGVSIDQSTPVIANCWIGNNDGNGIKLKDTNIEIKHCFIRYNTGHGIELDASHISASNSIISSNTLNGIHSRNNQDAINLLNVVIADNQGIGLSSEKAALTVKNSIIFDNNEQIFIVEQLPDVSYSAVQGDTIYPGTGNINSLPEFEDHNIYTLSQQSPCIDRGDPSDTYNDKYFPPSLGGIRNDMGAYGGPEAYGWFPSLYVKPQNLDFGRVSQDSSKSMYLNIHNYRNSGIAVSQITFHGDDSLVFSTDRENFFLPVSDSLELMLSFQPDREAIFQAVLVLRTLLHGDVYIPLHGEGIVSKMEVQLSELDFDEVTLGDSASLYLPIQNSGTDTLRLNMTLQSNSVFTLRESSLLVGPESALDSVEVTFEPNLPINLQDSLIISSNDPDNRRVAISVKGQGIGPVIHLDTEQINFGNVSVFSDTTVYLSISNPGNYPLLIDSLKIIGQDPDSITFEIINIPQELPVTLEPNNSIIMQVGFTPIKAGVANAQILIKSSDPFREEALVGLSGTGIAAEILLSTSELNFGQVSLDSDSSITLYIYNKGLAELFIPYDSIYITGSHFNAYLMENITEDITVIPNDSIVINIKFQPIQTGINQAELSISSNDPVDSELVVTLTGIGYDASPVSVNFDQSLSSNPFINGQDATISFIITGSQSIDSAFVNVKTGGDQMYTRLVLDKQSIESWSAQIDDSLVTERGVEYYVQVHHGPNLTYYPINGNIIPNAIQVTVPKIQFPWQTKNEIYQMISIPLATSGQDLQTLFQDELGTYDNTKYRIYELTDGSQYTEIASMDKTLPPGKAVWLITKEAKNLEISDAQSVITNQNFELKLEQGWNLISTPFAFSVNWNQVSTELALRYYDGTDWPFVSLMEPFKGYAVKVANDTVLSIPAQAAPIMKPLLKVDQNQLSMGWRIQILAESSNLKDFFNYVGAFEQTSSGIDCYDYPEPPPIGDFISLYLAANGASDKFSTDYRQLGMEQYVFEFEMSCNIKEKVKIYFHEENLPENYDWIVVSEDKGQYYPQRIIHITNKLSRYKMIIGTERYISEAKSKFKQLPINYTIEQNYPNPFNPSTTIKFSLPEESLVTINIYNILGQKIISPLESTKMEPGNYQIEWDGKNTYGNHVSSGIYFLQFKTTKYNHYIKMILSR